MKCTEKQITIKGNRVCYIDEGARDNATIVFIHGFPFNKEMWQQQLNAFERTHRVIAYDIRGHGGSDLGTEEFSIVQFADDLLQFMDALSLHKASVCALSMGGYIALSVLQTNPERIEALILCDTQCTADSNEAREKRIKAIASIRLGGIDRYAEDTLKNLFSPESFNTRAEEVSFIKSTILGTNHDSICKTLLALANRKATCMHLGNTKIPVLIMVGTEDKITPPESAHKMHLLIPGSTMEIIGNSGHLSNLENPTAFNKHLASFMQQL